MAEQNRPVYFLDPEIRIKMGTEGFLVAGSHYGGDELRAFSTPEGLIEWLSRELGAGPIVWAWTLPIWAEMVGVKEEDLLPMPDPNVDPTGYRETQEAIAAFLITRFADKVIGARAPKPPPEPKPKKEKKVKEEKPEVLELDSKGKWRDTGRKEEEKPKDEKSE